MSITTPVAPALEEATVVAKKAMVPLESGGSTPPPPTPKTTGQLWPR